MSPMSLAPLKARQIERRLLAFVFMCFEGRMSSFLDALYSAVMVGSGLVALRISRNLVRPPDRAYPYGYDGQEALYVFFRS